MSKFIVLEGPDGAGTTLHTKLLCEKLADGKKIFMTAEPSKGPIGVFARNELKRESRLSPAGLQTIFSADRAWHIEAEILPALERGETVISDRYSPSTIIYGEALGVSKDLLENMNTNFIHPDILFLLLPPYDVCRERLKRRRDYDRMENDVLQQRVYAGYQKYAVEHPEVIVINTAGDKDVVAALIHENAES